MKRINVLQLIASILLLVGNVINLLNLFMEIPFVVYMCSGPLFLISVILNSVVLAKEIKLKRIEEDTDDN